jgi:ATP-dependent DNA helicase RecQ
MKEITQAQGEILLQKAVCNTSAKFRPGQWEAIDAIVNQRKKELVVQRTGWGKSIVYFISAFLLREKGYGPALIISPLLALMRNQLDAAARLGLHAVTINSANTKAWPQIHGELSKNEVDLLLISPERLSNDQFMQNVLLPISGNLGFLVVDEAHCISDWGHDFRPDYQRIVNILKKLPSNMPLLGTTATANQRVIEDIRRQFGEIDIQRGPLARASLRLQTIRLGDQAERLAWLAENLRKLPGTGIIYTATVKDAERVSRWLQSKGYDAPAYYSDVSDEQFEDSSTYREYLEECLQNNRIKALVATTALGMGYDKPDLSFVIHFQAPGSVIAYYQQVGRAGRALEKAWGILLAGREDEDIHDYFRRTAFPAPSAVQEILGVLEKYQGLSIREIEPHTNLRFTEIEKTLKLLSVENPSPLIKEGAKWFRTAVEFTLDTERIQRLTDLREREWLEIENYIDYKGCLMNFLQKALDDENIYPCGKCANCLPQPEWRKAVDFKLLTEARRFLRQSDMPIIPKKQLAKSALSQIEISTTIPVELRNLEGRVLSRWGDAGWGRLVENAKHTGEFSDELVTAMAEMIQRWNPQPAPQWLTCVPSLRHPRLVPAFAEKLAAKLAIPFILLVEKSRETNPQKLMENRYHQIANLDHAFTLRETPIAEPLFLLDDIVDSGWTFTIIGLLLRQGGSGEVRPIALASTEKG